MIYDTYLDDLGLQYVYGCDPFCLDDLYDVLERRVRRGGAAGDLSRAMFLDLSEANLLTQTEAGFRRFIMRRRTLGGDTVQNDLCVLVGDIGSFGMMRMYGILAEIAELRDESRMFASLEIGGAAGWIARRLGRSDGQTVRLRLEELATLARDAICADLPGAGSNGRAMRDLRRAGGAARSG